MPRIVNLRYLGTAESIIQRLASAPSDEPQEECSHQKDRRGKGKIMRWRRSGY